MHATVAAAENRYPQRLPVFEKDQARQSVDDRPPGLLPRGRSAEFAARSDKEAGDRARAVQRSQQRARLATPVGHEHDVLGQQSRQFFDLSVPHRLFELLKELFSLLGRRGETRPARLDVPARAGKDLPAVCVAFADDGRDLGELMSEDLPQDEDHAFRRRERFQQNQKRQRRYVSCTMSCASITVPSMRYAMPKSMERCSSKS
jgi:hypothetical protein